MNDDMIVASRLAPGDLLFHRDYSTFIVAVEWKSDNVIRCVYLAWRPHEGSLELINGIINVNAGDALYFIARKCHDVEHVVHICDRVVDAPVVVHDQAYPCRATL